MPFAFKRVCPNLLEINAIGNVVELIQIAKGEGFTQEFGLMTLWSGRDHNVRVRGFEPVNARSIKVTYTEKLLSVAKSGYDVLKIGIKCIYAF